MTDEIRSVELRPFTPTTENLRELWPLFSGVRETLADDAVSDPFAFAAWLTDPNTLSFVVGPKSWGPYALFVFSDIMPGAAAFAHVFVWERHHVAPLSIRNAARAACGAVLQRFNLRRISGLTPCNKPEARIFAEQVGFKIEGRLRKAVSVGGAPLDAWISGLTIEDLQAAVAKDAEKAPEVPAAPPPSEPPDMGE